MLVCIVIEAHAMLVLLIVRELTEAKLYQPGGDENQEQVAKSLLYHGVTQVLFGLLGFYFSIFGLRRQNDVEIMAAVYLVGSVIIFDISALTNVLPVFQAAFDLKEACARTNTTVGYAANDYSSNSSTSSNTTGTELSGDCTPPKPLPFLVSLIFPSPPDTTLGFYFRMGFFALLMILWMPMLYYGLKARVDFGWRIFKL